MSNEYIHNALVRACRCYFESKAAAMPMAKKLGLPVAFYDRYYYVMPRTFDPGVERAAGRPYAWFCYNPKEG